VQPGTGSLRPDRPESGFRWNSFEEAPGGTARAPLDRPDYIVIFRASEVPHPLALSRQ
jgi:hypothetical protein